MIVTKVIADISMSLDGYVTGPDPDLEHGLGVGGEPLHDWAVGSDDETDAAVLREATEATGAVVMGRRLFEIVDGPRAGDRCLLMQESVRVSSTATHLTYRVEPGAGD
jgi:dihydrofolate reductase